MILFQGRLVICYLHVLAHTHTSYFALMVFTFYSVCQSLFILSSFFFQLPEVLTGVLCTVYILQVFNLFAWWCRRWLWRVSLCRQDCKRESVCCIGQFGVFVRSMPVVKDGESVSWCHAYWLGESLINGCPVIVWVRMYLVASWLGRSNHKWDILINRSLIDRALYREILRLGFAGWGITGSVAGHAICWAVKSDWNSCKIFKVGNDVGWVLVNVQTF